MEKLRVSVIIPTYKRPEFLERAIKSVINQTYHNIEIIVVSDNDVESEYENETVAIIKQFSEVENILYLPAIGNQGGCYARNRGLGAANGEYVNFFDDDDVMYPTKIERQVEIIEKSDKMIAVIGCCAAIRNEKGNIYRTERPEFDPSDILFSELKKNICTTSINIVNTEVCRKAGGFEYIESSQEHLFLIKVFSICPTFDFVDETLVEIDQHTGSRVSNNNKRPIGALKLTKRIETFYNKFDDKKVKQLKLARYAEDIRAYCCLRKYKEAWKLYLKRIGICLFDLENIKLPVMAVQSLIGK